MIDCNRSERDMAMPIGMPNTIAVIVQTVTMAMVRIVSSHMPKMPMVTSASNVPSAIFQLRLPA